MRAAIPDVVFSVPGRVAMPSVALLRRLRVGSGGGGGTDATLAACALADGTEVRELRRSAMMLVLAVALVTVSEIVDGVDVVAIGAWRVSSTSDDGGGSGCGCGDNEAIDMAGDSGDGDEVIDKGEDVVCSLRDEEMGEMNEIEERAACGVDGDALLGENREIDVEGVECSKETGVEGVEYIEIGSSDSVRIRLFTGIGVPTWSGFPLCTEKRTHERFPLAA